MDRPDIDALWEYRDPVASEARFRALMPSDASSVDAGWHAELLSQLARALCLQRRYEEAHAVLDGAMPLLAEATPRAAIRVRLERGRTLNDTGRTDEAVALFREAWARADAAGEIALAADALHMLAYVTRGDENLRWHRIALEFCERHDEPRLRRWATTLHTNLADEYERQRDYANARRAVEQGIALAEELGLEEKVRSASIFLARLHRLDGALDRAWALIESVFDPADPLGWGHEEYAECLRARGEVEASRPHFRRAHELLSKDPWFPPQEHDRLERLARLAEDG